jgi:hypothetical protein
MGVGPLEVGTDPVSPETGVASKFELFLLTVKQ